jgi:starvation-inducible DNA-binding protein
MSHLQWKEPFMPGITKRSEQKPMVIEAGDRPNIGLRPEDQTAVSKILNATLADEFVLTAKTKNYHWNVRGIHFHSLHLFLDTQYQELALMSDDVAERVRSVGGFALGTLQEFSQFTRLQEHPGQHPEAQEMLADLTADHEAIIRHLRADLQACADQYHDMGTSDFLTGLMERHEKMAWMLRSFLG